MFVVLKYHHSALLSRPKNGDCGQARAKSVSGHGKNLSVSPPLGAMAFGFSNQTTADEAPKREPETSPGTPWRSGALAARCERVHMANLRKS
jgi:hypothetical protein